MPDRPAASPPDEDVDAALARLRQHVEASAFHGWAGLELVSVEVGVVEVALPVQAHHLNPGGILHGGLIATLADTAIGLAVRSALPAEHTHVTAQLDVKLPRARRSRNGSRHRKGGSRRSADGLR